MNFNYKQLLPSNFSSDSRVWVYQSSRHFNMDEIAAVETMLKEFTQQWKSHGDPVKGAAFIFFEQFIILMADERATGISGCSTDSSVRLIKNIEQQFDINLFDRTTLAFIINEKVQLLPMSQLQNEANSGFINAETLYFNNLVQTKSELEETWIIPVRESWLAKKISFANAVS